MKSVLSYTLPSIPSQNSGYFNICFISDHPISILLLRYIPYRGYAQTISITFFVIFP